VPDYRAEIPQYAYLNSYYNAAGDMHRRDMRGLIASHGKEAQRYRSSIDSMSTIFCRMLTKTSTRSSHF
jgi:hypothetical protein